jgi:hypothetical protein
MMVMTTLLGLHLTGVSHHLLRNSLAPQSFRYDFQLIKRRNGARVKGSLPVEGHLFSPVFDQHLGRKLVRSDSGVGAQELLVPHSLV